MSGPIESFISPHVEVSDCQARASKGILAEPFGTALRTLPDSDAPAKMLIPHSGIFQVIKKNVSKRPNNQGRGTKYNSSMKRVMSWTDSFAFQGKHPARKWLTLQMRIITQMFIWPFFKMEISFFITTFFPMRIRRIFWKNTGGNGMLKMLRIS